MKLFVKRVYDKKEAKDGKRILVDRLWPRGLTKEKAAADIWLKEIAPSTELRKWFSHDPGKWVSFQKKYTTELENNKEAVAVLRKEIKSGTVTLLYAAKDEQHNEALVLKNWMSKK